ncbi:MAG: metallophosphoesterase [Anaerolineae bacterium]
MMYPHLRHFDDGVAMVVTDLHGEGVIFDRVLQTFFDLREDGKADRLIICGDLLHIRRSAEDHSLRMIREVMRWQEKLGDDTIIMLMGNHEMPHIYSLAFSKGDEEYTASFEHTLTASGHRQPVMDFLRSLPFYATTHAGVLITHAGASVAVTEVADVQNLLTFDHQALLHLGDDLIRNQIDIEMLKADEAYQRDARAFTAVDDVDDPRFTHLLRGQIIANREDQFHFLWDVLFARNEQKWGEAYPVIVDKFLEAVSEAIGQTQRVVLSGHIATQGGHAIVTPHHLRLSSYAHAHPHSTGVYLLLDCGQAVTSADDLLPALYPVLS